jgi:hypothetical protein
MKITRKQIANFNPFEISIIVENVNEQIFLQSLFGAFSVNEILNKASCKFDKEYVLNNKTVAIADKLLALYDSTITEDVK